MSRTLIRIIALLVVLLAAVSLVPAEDVEQKWRVSLAAGFFNPHDEIALQQAIKTGVEMHRHERRQRMAALRAQIRRSDLQGWADRFLAELSAAADAQSTVEN